jgi:hypothetical protein
MSGHAEKQLHDLALLELHFVSVPCRRMRGKRYGTFHREMNPRATLTWPYGKLRNGEECDLLDAVEC